MQNDISSSKSNDQSWDEWRDLVNMAPGKLDDWLVTAEPKSGGDTDSGESTGHKSGVRIVKIKRTNKDELSDDQRDHIATVIGYIKRHLSQGGPDDGVENSDWRYSLMNWGHNPVKEDG